MTGVARSWAPMDVACMSSFLCFTFSVYLYSIKLSIEKMANAQATLATFNGAGSQHACALRGAARGGARSSGDAGL